MLDNSYKTQGNYNNHIGLPLTILNCPIDAKYLVLELGTSRFRWNCVFSKNSKAWL